MHKFCHLYRTNFGLHRSHTSQNHIISTISIPCSFKSTTSSNPSIATLSHAADLVDQGAVIVSWHDGFTSKFHKKWLRDHCSCPSCLHPDTYQRLVDTYSIPTNPMVQMLEISKVDEKNALSKNMLTISWDQKVNGSPCMTSTYTSTWLRQHAYGSSSTKPVHHQQEVVSKMLWNNSLEIPTHLFSTNKVEETRRILKDMYTYGIVCVSSTPSTMVETETFALTTFHSILETIYGRMWTTRPESSEQEYNDTASTNQALYPHTDCTYLREPPGIQIFNCIQQSNNGGESCFIDGFAVAEKLRKVNNKAFQVLSTTPLRWQHFEDDAHLETMETMFKVNPLTQEVVQIRFNDYDRGILTHLSFDQVTTFYEAHSHFMEILRDPEMEKRIKLNEGDMILVDNQRVLHGRYAFDGSPRALIGCYIGRVEYESRLRMFGII